MADDELAAFLADVQQVAADVAAAPPKTLEEQAAEAAAEDAAEAAAAAAAAAPAKPAAAAPRPFAPRAAVRSVLSRPAVLSAPPQPPPAMVAVAAPAPPQPPPRPPMLPFGGGAAWSGAGGGGAGAGAGAGAGGGVPGTALAAPGARTAGKKFLRSAAGEVWEDPTLAAWPENDFRLFVSDLGNEVTDEMLASAFRKYPSFAKARMVKQKLDPGKVRPYGFVSFLDPWDALAALKDMEGAYVGGRPMRLMKSNWADRSLQAVRKKGREDKK